MSISGYAELLKDGIVRPEDQKEFAGRIYQEAARLTTLVQDIIRLSKLDDENLELEKETIDLFEMSKEIIETLQPAAKKRHISISYQGKRLSISACRRSFMKCFTMYVTMPFITIKMRERWLSRPKRQKKASAGAWLIRESVFHWQSRNVFLKDFTAWIRAIRVRPAARVLDFPL